MKKNNKLLLLSCLFLLFSCGHRGKMNLDHFSKKEPKERTIAFRINFNYNGDEKPADSPTCMINFADSGKRVFKMMKYRVKDNYIFINTDADEIYLNSIRCSSYRVFYLKNRIYKLNEKIATLRNGGINYGGDIEINWTPKIFVLFDLLVVGAGDLIQDEGSFSMKIENNYKEFQDFLKKNYGSNLGSTVDAVDNNIVGKVISAN